MIIKLMLLTAAAAAAATAANKTFKEKLRAKPAAQAQTTEELLLERGACMDEPDAQRYGMDYMYV